MRSLIEIFSWHITMFDLYIIIGFAILVAMMFGFYNVVKTLREYNATVLAACNIVEIPTVKKEDIANPDPPTPTA